MASKKKKAYSPKARGKSKTPPAKNKPQDAAAPKKRASSTTIDAKDLVLLIIDIWRLNKRLEHETISEPIQNAVERIEERLRGLGFTWKSLEGQPYDSKAVMIVIEDRSNGKDCVITECLTPAVYYKDKLIEPSKVILGGDSHVKKNR